jgi:hypothetical protein
MAYMKTYCIMKTRLGGSVKKGIVYKMKRKKTKKKEDRFITEGPCPDGHSSRGSK